MRISKSWIVAAKDVKTFRRKKNIVYSVLAVPFIVAVLLPLVVEYAGRRSGPAGFPPQELLVLLPAFIFFFVILAAYVPTPIASYTLIGEKVERSLEPLLATPTTDEEILLGKGIAAFLPAMGALLGAVTLFMVLMDIVTYSKLGFYYFPNWNAGIVLFLLVPLACIMSIQVNVAVSSRVSDVRTGQQVGALTILPFAGLYVAGELNILPAGDTTNLLGLVGILVVVDLVLLLVTKATFEREEILTKWK